jgi:hypothetical protein
MPIARVVIVGLFAAALAAFGAKAQPGESSRPPQDCFLQDRFRSWRAPDPSTIYIRVAPNNYYRLDLSGQCSILKSPQAHLITNSHGKNTICSPLDWDIRVSQADNSAQEQCAVRAMTKLNSAEVAAIPKAFKP